METIQQSAWMALGKGQLQEGAEWDSRKGQSATGVGTGQPGRRPRADTQPGRAGTNLSQVLTSAVSTPECGRLRVPKETFLKVPLLTFSDQKLMHIHIENLVSTKKA